MRTLHLALFLGILLAGAGSPVSASSTPPAKEDHPGSVALIQEGDNWTYRHFPSNLRLYVFDKDSPGKSVCTDSDGCAGVWPPLLASDESKSLGDWTVIVRAGMQKQWAYKGRPVYLHYHDSPFEPSGDGFGGVWHFLEP